MSGPGSVDDMAAQPFQAPGRPYRAAYMAPAVTAPWLPGASVLENGLNCSFDSGASYAPRDLAKPVSLPECFQRCQADRRCDAVRAAWWAVQRNWSARQVGCRLRGGVNLPACTIQKGSNSANVRCSTFAADAPAKSQLAVAVSALAGYRMEPQHLWSVAPQPGDSGGTLPALLTAARSEPALGLAAIRLSAPAASAPTLRSCGTTCWGLGGRRSPWSTWPEPAAPWSSTSLGSHPSCSVSGRPPSDAGHHRAYW